MKRLFWLFLIFSLLLNIVLASGLLLQTLNGCAEVADGRVGKLKETTIVGAFGGSDQLFTLPEGLVVRDASASGAGWFEPHRFKIVVTSDRSDLVDYDNSLNEMAEQDSEYYSAYIELSPLHETTAD